MTPAEYYKLCQAGREEMLDGMFPRRLLEFADAFESYRDVVNASTIQDTSGRAWRPLMTRLRELASGLLDRIEGPVCADPCNSSCDCTLCEKIRVEDAIVKRADQLIEAAYPLQSFVPERDAYDR